MGLFFIFELGGFQHFTNITIIQLAALINYSMHQGEQKPVGKYYMLRSHNITRKHQIVNKAKRRRLMLAVTLRLLLGRC